MEALERNCQNPHDNSDTTSSKLGDFLVELANIFYAQCAALGAESDEELRAVRESLLALIYMRHCQCDPLLQESKCNILGDAAPSLRSHHLVGEYLLKAFGVSLLTPHSIKLLDQSSNMQRDVIDFLWGDCDNSELNAAFTDPTILGLCYESLLGPVRSSSTSSDAASSKNKEGIFYTPPFIVELIVEQTLKRVAPRCNTASTKLPRVLDPACGTGFFLIRAFRHLTRNFSLQVSLEERAHTVLSHLIYGVDKDSYAIELAKLTLLLEYTRLVPEFLNSAAEPPELLLRVGNSLIDTTMLSISDIATHDRLQPLNWAKEFPDVIAAGGFDCVFGNPPYGLARGEQIENYENEILKKHYSDVRSGKANKYMLFMAKGYELTAPHGCLSFVVPNSWLGIRSGRKLRQMFLSERSLASVHVFDFPVFQNSIVEPVVFTVDRQMQHDTIKLVRHPGPKTDTSSSEVPVDSCLKLPEQMIPTSWSQQVARVFTAIWRDAIPLSSKQSGVISRIALQAYATGKGTPPQSKEDVKQHIFHSTRKKGRYCHPYLHGKDVQRLRINWSGQFLKHGPWLAEPQLIERFQGPRVLVREITARAPYTITACATDRTYLYNKSILHILPTSDAMRDINCMRAIAAVLSSKLGTFVLMFQGKKAQRKIFPKLVNDDLLHFPLPRRFAEHVDRLSALSEKLSKAYEMLPESDSSQLTIPGYSLVRFLEERIDREIYATYGIDKEQYSELERAISSRAAA